MFFSTQHSKHRRYATYNAASPLREFKTHSGKRSMDCQPASGKSTQSGGSSPRILLECEETFEDLSFCLESVEVTAKGSPSFISEIHGVQPPPPEFEQVEFKEEETTSKTLWKPRNKKYLDSLVESELSYMPNPYALHTLQSQITPKMRAILLDWMTEVCAELALKRETLYLAVSYVDRLLSTKQNVGKDEFQLVGLATMSIAAEIEEIYPPSLSDWAKTAENGYNTLQIKKMQVQIFKHLEWKLLPGTPYNFLSWLMNEWDNFIEFHFGCVQCNNLDDLNELLGDEKKKQTELFEKRFIVFKYANQSAYKRYRETMQILDTTILDSGVLLYQPKVLAAAVFYLMISKYFYESQYSLLYYNGPQSSFIKHEEDEVDQELNFEGASVVQDLYAGFVSAALEIHHIQEIYSAVSFVHHFLQLKIAFDLPVICKIQPKSRLESHYEEFLSYQTHNKNSIALVSNKLNS